MGKQKSNSFRVRTVQLAWLLITIGGVPAVSAQQPVFPLLNTGASPNLTACSGLNNVELPELSALIAEWMPSGSAGFAGEAATDEILPEHCRVRGVIEPDIRFEIWLPAPESWNGRFLAIGNNELAGTIRSNEMRQALAQGYATASTDTGHRTTSLTWLSDDGLLRDFAYRAIYEMSAKAGLVVADFFGRPADYRYFNGCGTGGRQGLVQAQRFPESYDGIVAGAPTPSLLDSEISRLWSARVAADSGQLNATTLASVTSAATARCDLIDGVADGLLEDPRRCNFDPLQLQCGSGGSGSCLSAAAASAVRDIYRGPTARANRQSIPGFVTGSESTWSSAASASPPAATVELFRRAVFGDALWDWRSFDFDADAEFAHQQLGWMLDAGSSDLSEFRNRGNKLILYHGWNDPEHSPLATIDYYERVEATLEAEPNPGRVATPDFARLFMVPGMQHCGGGSGVTRFDAQRAIEDWVERGIAPSRIEAERIENEETTLTRPLCPYPQTARYRGSGNTDRSGSFICSD